MKDASPVARFWAEFRESRTAVIALAVVVLMQRWFVKGLTEGEK